MNSIPFLYPRKILNITTLQRSQDAYKKAVIALFHSLERVENHLRQVHSEGPYFWGRRLSESDIRLFTTIVRFDVVYHYHFKCNLKDIRSGFPAIHDWLRHLYWDILAFKETTHFEFIKENYTKDQKHINPFGITALGPVPHILPKGEEVESVKEVARRW
jgi:glutathionyl-hydroquinone reductase